jgi:hypothetical protein
MGYRDSRFLFCDISVNALGCLLVYRVEPTGQMLKMR